MPDYSEAKEAMAAGMMTDTINVTGITDPVTGFIRPESLVVDVEALAVKAAQGLADAGMVAVPYFRDQPGVESYRLCRALVSANLATIAELAPGGQPAGPMNDITNELLAECVDPYGSVAVMVASMSHLVNLVAMHYEMDPLAWWQVFCEQATRDEEAAHG